MAVASVSGCNCFNAKSGDRCSDEGELVCGEPNKIGTADGIKILHCETQKYAYVGDCPQTCDHVTGVRTSVGCGDQTIRAVQNSRCDSNGGACSMDQSQVMNCTSGTWTSIGSCFPALCVKKSNGNLGCNQ
jgi:hypothetical protein